MENIGKEESRLLEDFVEAFCLAASAETGDRWEAVEWEDGTGWGVIQNFAEPEGSPDDGTRVSGAVYAGAGTKAELGKRILFEASGKGGRGVFPRPDGWAWWPVPWLEGCSSAEEGLVRIAVNNA